MLVLFLGLFISVLGGEPIAFSRYLNTPLPKFFWWAHTVSVAALVVFSQWQNWRRALRDDDGPPSPAPRWREAATVMAFGLSLVSLYALREVGWAAPALALIGALFCRLLARFQNRRYPVAVAGWLLAGMVVLLLPWANEHRLGAVEFLGGLAMVVQGGWDFVRRSGRAAIGGFQ